MRAPEDPRISALQGGEYVNDSEPSEEDSADTWMEEALPMAEAMETEEDDLQMAV